MKINMQVLHVKTPKFEAIGFPTANHVAFKNIAVDKISLMKAFIQRGIDEIKIKGVNLYEKNRTLYWIILKDL